MPKPASEMTGGELQIIRDKEDEKLLRRIAEMMGDYEDPLEEDEAMDRYYEEKYGQ